MGSKKGSAKAKQRAEFQAGLDGFGGMDDLFAREAERKEQREEERDAVLRWKACEKKNHYASAAEAEDAIRACERYGTHGLHSYRCPHCRGWHLTSKPQQ